MIPEFLEGYLSIIIFLFIALGLSVGFIVLNFLFSPRKLTLKNSLLTNVDLKHLTIQEGNLI